MTSRRLSILFFEGAFSLSGAGAGTAVRLTDGDTGPWIVDFAGLGASAGLTGTAFTRAAAAGAGVAGAGTGRVTDGDGGTGVGRDFFALSASFKIAGKATITRPNNMLSISSIGPKILPYSQKNKRWPDKPAITGV